MIPATRPRGAGAMSARIPSHREGTGEGGRRESIYNLLPNIHQEKMKPPMYKSRVDHTKEIAYSTFDQRKLKSGMYGVKGGGRSRDPRNFLRRGEGLEARRRAGKRPELARLDHYAIAGISGGVRPERRKPPVPRREERPTMGLRSGKNFVTANAVEAILAVPIKRERPPINYRDKEDYGRVPAYLAHVKAEVSAENDMVEEFVREQMGISSIDEEEAPTLPKEEQKKLVDQLKAKWDDVNTRYQRCVHQTLFEHGRLASKARMEKELDEIEGDIAKLTRGPVAIAP